MQCFCGFALRLAFIALLGTLPSAAWGLSLTEKANLQATMQRYIDQQTVDGVFLYLEARSGKVTLRIRYRSQSGYVFQVIDSGIGIAFEDIPKALAPFQQVDSGLNRKHEGTGLGLPLTNALVELHGGSLDLQSEVGVGTTVTVRFPAERIESEAATEMPLPSVQTARATRQ